MEGGGKMIKLKDRNDWFELWLEDKKAMLETMTRNIAADLSAGYDFYGRSIQRSLAEMDSYKAEYESALEKFKDMEESAVNRWCFYDLLKRGAIE